MSLALWSTVAAFGTFIVIAATAIAAVVQLRHLRASNQLEGLLNVLGRSEEPAFDEWVKSLTDALQSDMPDPQFRKSLLEGTFDRRKCLWIHLFNWYDYIGLLVKRGLVPKDAILDVYSYRLIWAWERSEEIIALVRRATGAGVWEDFELLAVLSRDWLAKYKDGNYPRGVRRMSLADKWRAADRVSSAG